MDGFKAALAMFMLALLLLTGCDSVQNDTLDATETDAPRLADAPDMSLIDAETEALLVHTNVLSPGLLRGRGLVVFGGVFTMSDAPEGNAIIAFRRLPNGRLTPTGTYPTNGMGSGDGLNGTSNPMALAADRYLYAVNGGSDEISIFSVNGGSLGFVGKVPSGGPRPISVTVRRGLLYVLNAGRDGEPGNITGFRITFGGDLRPLDGSTQPLNDGAGNPSQILFNPAGTLLVVTDKPTNSIATYIVNQHGIAGAPQTQAANGQTTFGFDFDRAGRLITSEAFGGAEDASALSSYAVSASGTINTLSASVPTTETAACWVETFGRYAYATNTGSSSITGFRIEADGTLTRLDEDGVTIHTGEGSRPLDLDIALRYLYVHSAGTNRIGIYRILGNGGLQRLPSAATDLPPTTVGVLAY